MNKDLNINFSVASVMASFARVRRSLQRYVVEIFAVSVLLIYGFLVWQINSLSNIPASEDKIVQEQQIIKRPRIDEETIKKIEQLEDQNIAVQSLFKAARDNPFTDN